MPDKGMLGYCCIEDEQLLYCLNPAHLLCGSMSLFLEHMCYSALLSTQMATAKSSTLHGFSRAAQPRLGKTAHRVTLCILQCILQMLTILQKSVYSAHYSLLGRMTRRLRKYAYNMCWKVSKRFTETLYCFCLASFFDLYF